MRCGKCTPRKGENETKGENRNYTSAGKYVSYNVLSYEVPFISGKEYFSNPCDCEKIAKIKKFCNDLKKSDPIPGLDNIDLKGVLVNGKEEISNKKSLKEGSLRFRQAKINNQKDLMNKLNNKKLNHECNCLNEVDRLSLFCEDKCKQYSDLMNTIKSFYDVKIKETESWFNNEINIIKK